MARDAAELLVSSPLFDAEWYALRTGVQGDRATLVAHYLTTPLEQRVSPHPLFDPEWFREQSPLDLRDKDPFLVYVRRRLFGTPTHPAFSTVHYRRTVPGAKEHPHGPIAHYVEVGAPQGIPGHRFLPVDANGRGPDLRAWHLERHRALVNPTPPPPASAPCADVVSVVIVVPAVEHAWRAAWESVTPLVEEGAVGRELQVLVVDEGAAPDDAVKLDVLALRHQEVEVLHVPSTEATTTADAPQADAWLPEVVRRTRGTTTVLVDHTLTVRAGWLAPLLATVAKPGVLAAQPLVLRPAGTVECAGVVVPEGGTPYSFLSGFPPEDAAGIERHTFAALTSACVAVRSADLPALVRATSSATATVAPGDLVVTPDSVVVQRQPGPVRPLGAGGSCSVQAEAALWRSHGFEVVSSAEAGAATSPPLVERPRAQVSEPWPRLRWAIKNPAPAGPVGERWGDTHFASSLAAALREVGQEVVVDRRESFARETGRFDDVDLLLRGLSPLQPTPGRVTLAWVISHPEALGAEEARAYDRVLAASLTWAEDHSRRWGIPIEPLLQATDPRLFHPDSASPDSGDPVLFVGSARGQYRPMVRDAVDQGVPLALHGTGWEDLVPASVLRGQYVPNAELSAAYRAAGVVLNDHWDDMRREGFLSNRLFDAVASGARVLTDDVAGLGDLFGRSVHVVRRPQDLARLTGLKDPDAVFGDDAERRTVAERIRREHSFVARARRLVEVAVDAARGRSTG